LIELIYFLKNNPKIVFLISKSAYGSETILYIEGLSKKKRSWSFCPYASLFGQAFYFLVMERDPHLCVLIRFYWFYHKKFSKMAPTALL